MSFLANQSVAKNLFKPTFLSVALLAIVGCSQIADTTAETPKITALSEPTEDSDSSAVVYYNGDIITMEGDKPQMVEAVVTKGGKIAYVGSLDEAQSKYANAAQVDLKDQTLLPGFIDPHSHFGMVSNTVGQADLNPPPVCKIDSIDKILAALKAYKKDNNIADGEWIFGWGYDETQLAEDRHPTKNEIDSVLPDNPVYLQHTSGHMGVANSKGLAEMDITAESKAPEVGNIARVKGSNEPNSLVQETAMYPFVRNLLEVLAPKQAEFFDRTQDYYAENGITTAQDGSTTRDAIKFFQSQADAGKLKIDLVSLAGVSDLDENLADNDFVWKTYQNGFKVQGTKIIADGSPQGKTSYFSQPYLTPVPDCDSDCKGSLTVGKLADLVILDANPLTIEPSKLKDIKVMQTIKEGKTIYQR